MSKNNKKKFHSCGTVRVMTGGEFFNDYCCSSILIDNYGGVSVATPIGGFFKKKGESIFKSKPNGAFTFEEINGQTSLGVKFCT